MFMRFIGIVYIKNETYIWVIFVHYIMYTNTKFNDYKTYKEANLRWSVLHPLPYKLSAVFN